MANATIPVDLLNPGQVFACLGIVEAADVLLGDAAGVFGWDNAEPHFTVSAHGAEDPLRRVLGFIDEAEVKTRVPSGSRNVGAWKSWMGDSPEQVHLDVFPIPDPSSPEKLPAVLLGAGEEIVVDHWGDGTRRDNVKFWTGPYGKPGSALLREATELVHGKTMQHAGDPFALSAKQESSFRFDWRRDYVPVEVGFSPNNHKPKKRAKPQRWHISPRGFPIVEILAAIGVTHARPHSTSRLEYRYGVLGGDEPLDPIFLRASLGAPAGPPVPVPYRRFVVRLDRPGEASKARCITHVVESHPEEN